jgi:hypothetical protein
LAETVFTVPAFSARRIFSIFIASTTASGWPASTLSPSPTLSAVSRPGIGQIRYLERSGGTFSIMKRLSSATWAGSTSTTCEAPRVVSRHCRPRRATWTIRRGRRSCP